MNLMLYNEIVEASKHVWSERDPDRKFFFQSSPIAVHTCLRSTSRILKVDPALKVNELRKLFAVWAKMGKTADHKGLEGESAEELFAKVALADKHRLTTAEAIYAAITPEQYAQLSKHCFLRLMGEPIEFPSTSEWKQFGRSIQELMPRGLSTQEPEDDDVEDRQLEQDLADLLSDDDIEPDKSAGGEDNADWINVLAKYDAAQGDDAHGDADGGQHVKDAPVLVRSPRAKRGAMRLKLAKRINDETKKRSQKFDGLQPEDAREEPIGVASAAVDAPGQSESSKAVHITSSPDAPSKNAARGKTSRRLQRRVSMHDKDKTAKKNEREKKKRQTQKMRKATAMSDDMSEEPRHTTQENITSLFSKKAAPKQSVSVSLNAFDTRVVDELGMKHEKGPHQLEEAEKKFLISELRSHQGDVNSPPVKHVTDEIIQKGRSMDPPALKQHDDVDDLFYHGVIKRFFSKFSLAATALAEKS